MVDPGSGRPSVAGGAGRGERRRDAVVSVVLLGVMLAITGLALDAAVTGAAGIATTGFGAGAAVPWPAAVLVVAGVVGAVAGASRLRVWVAHLGSALVGTALLLGAWGVVLARGDGSDPLDALRAAATALLDSWVAGRVAGAPLAVLVVVGAFAWATGYLAGFELIRRDRPAGPVVTLGTTLAVLAVADQPGVAVPAELAAVFAGAALVLLLRSDLAARRASWARRGVQVLPAADRRLLRAGALMGGFAIVAATALAGALTAPRFDLPGASALQGPGSAAGSVVASAIRDRVPVGDEWVTSETPVLAVRPSDGEGHYLARDHHAVFDGAAWSAGPGVTVMLDVAAGQDVPDPDRTTLRPARTLRLVVTNLGSSLTAVPAPGGLRTLDRPAQAVTRDTSGSPIGIAFSSSVATGGSWQMTADVPLPGTLAAAQIRSMDAEPAWLDRYRGPVAPAVLDARARALATSFRDGHAETDALHVAARLEAFFAGTDLPVGATPRFRYATSIRDLCAPGQGVVACLLEQRVGFCQQYATAMTLMLQSLGIPARYVEGFLPGSAGPDGVWTVPASAAHAWVEVHAGGMGWVRFDPTPGGGRNGQTTSAERLGLVARTTGGDPEARPTTADTRIRPTPTPETTAATRTPGPTLPDPPARGLVGILLARLVLAAIAGRGWRHRARRPDPIPDRDPRVLYRALVAEATLAGLGPRGGQTELEFARALGAVVPDAAEHVLLVARATVESTYGQRDPDAAALDRVADAFRIARRALSRIRRVPPR